MIPENFIVHYNFLKIHTKYIWVCINVILEMYGLPKSGIISNKPLSK